MRETTDASDSQILENTPIGNKVTRESDSIIQSVGIKIQMILGVAVQNSLSRPQPNSPKSYTANAFISFNTLGDLGLCLRGF